LKVIVRLPIALLALSLLAVADTSRAQSGPTGFQSPSKNIACQYFDYDKQSSLRCDVAVMETNPRCPANCDLEYGHAFEMNSKGGAERICYGDTVIDKSLPVLAYGDVWQRGRFTVGAERGYLLQRRPARIFAVAGRAEPVLKTPTPHRPRF
jgi:hypothetical protein